MKKTSSKAFVTMLLLMLVSIEVQAQALPFETIINNGSSQNRVDIAVLGDGYIAGEAQKYKDDVRAFIAAVFAEEPFREYQRYFNVRRIDVISNQSGADHPERSVFVDTALDATYNCQGIQRLICVNNTKVNNIIASTLAATQHDVTLVIVNDSEYGGSGGAVAVASTNMSAVEIILHEEGHSFALLGDEYGGPPPPVCDNSIEPSEPNVTRQTQRALIKWNSWIDPGTPIPTTSTGNGVPGLYEGARYCDFGLYRPTYGSKMRFLGRPYEQVNGEQLIKRIYNWVSPLDSSTPTASNITLIRGQTQVFGVLTPTPFTHTLTVNWSVDGQQRASGWTFVLNSGNLSVGNHGIVASINDATMLVRIDPNQVLVAQRTWNVRVDPPSATPTPTAAPGTFGNISTRLRVETGDNVLIGGFIINGTQPKKIIVRAIGPSLPLAGALADPILELRNSSGGLIASNDNWRSDQQAEIIATGIPPSNNFESAIVATLPANNSAYTAIVRGVNNGTGIGVVEAYDLDRTVDSKLANISTRGLVQTGDNVLIGGLIVLGQNPLRVIVRAIGPSLPVPGALGNPTLELRDGNGALIASNDNWRTDQEAEIIATGIPPSNNLESAIVRNLPPGSYTAIVRGVNGTTGIALIEAYGLN